MEQSAATPRWLSNLKGGESALEFLHRLPPMGELPVAPPLSQNPPERNLGVKEKVKERWVFACKETTAAISPNMRAIQSNLALIGRNVSNLSPLASRMMDCVCLWQEGGGSTVSVRFSLFCLEHVWLHSCMPMSPDAFCRVCVPASAIRHAGLEKAVRELLIQRLGRGHTGSKLSV